MQQKNSLTKSGRSRKDKRTSANEGVREVFEVANIMVVDDAAFMRIMMKDILEKGNHTVVAEAENGKQALLEYAKTKPDLVTLDITMPELDGLNTLLALKKLDPNAKVVMVSAMGQQNIVIQAIKAGAKDFVVKPFQPERVLEAVNKALSS
ncbi:MAG: two-component system, chemotaxis family, chemotaxis protein CheY [Thermovirga sp.]|nr:two-component system, chemotaxis family, chemotaxis protein CheY [Thermovirga sp.]MDN5368141.1 two-component system, chemotaxis family, chemotaxis protein CheY [Thermovirga sp.]